MTLITPDRLSSLVLEATRGVTDLEAERSRIVASLILREQIFGDTESDSSKKLRHMLSIVKSELGQKNYERFSKIDIFGIQMDYINAIPDIDDGRERIIIFDGMIKFVEFFTNAIKISDLLMLNRPNSLFRFPSGRDVPEVFAFLSACIVLMIAFKDKSHAPENLDAILAQDAKNDALAGIYGAVTFIMLHELAHIELDHLSLNGAKSTASAFTLLEEQELGADRHIELEADEHAILQIPQEARNAFIPSIIFFLGGFSIFEAYGGEIEKSHPLAVNRLHCILKNCGTDRETISIAEGWVRDRVERYREFAGRRSFSGGGMLDTVYQTMSIEEARDTVRQIGNKVLAETGPLGYVG